MYRSCILCGADAARSLFFCADCMATLPAMRLACDRCGNPLSQSATCGRCLRKPPIYTRYLGGYWYQFPIDRLIIAAKFHGRLEILTALGHLFAHAFSLAEPDPLPQALIAVPLHRLRLLQRGYNQTIEIARPMAKTLDLPLLVDACQRLRHTRPQSQLVGKERRKNVKDAFSTGTWQLSTTFTLRARPYPK
jgi:ComF family protein